MNIAILMLILSWLVVLVEAADKKEAKPFVVRLKGRSPFILPHWRLKIIVCGLIALFGIVAEHWKTADDRNRAKMDALEKVGIRERLDRIQQQNKEIKDEQTRLNISIAQIKDNTKDITNNPIAETRTIEPSTGGLVGVPVDTRYGQSNEVGQMAGSGYDSAKDIRRVLLAMSSVPSSMAGMAISFGQRDGSERAMNVAKGLGIGFGNPTAVHLIGGLGEGL